ncbi:MAG: hydrogenase maturation nickel metallochaperone HypA [Gammaproteobacteria bacterium]|nr:hydrogenase maturation nickel metallochaperone HypA [Gammaproteobacteria bacterium]
MHEMSLCESILQIIENEARQQGFVRVTRVRLEIGRLAGAEPEAMKFGFDAVTRGSLAEGARLEILNIPGRAWCMACAREVEIDNRFDACPQCGGFQLQVTGGEQLRIKDLEVE